MTPPHTDPVRSGHPYRVPDGYFSDLRGTLRERIGGSPAEADAAASPAGGLWGRVRGLVGLSAAFGCLVLLATVGYYFTGYQAQEREQLAMQDQTEEAMLGYRIYTEDLESLVVDDEGTGEERQLFAQAVTEYLVTYGYDTADEGMGYNELR